MLRDAVKELDYYGNAVIGMGSNIMGGEGLRNVLLKLIWSVTIIWNICMMNTTKNIRTGAFSEVKLLPLCKAAVFTISH